MRVTESTEYLFFVAPISGVQSVKIVNETTKAVVFEQDLEVNNLHFFNFVGVKGIDFNLKDKEHYQLFIGDNYRATIFCYNDLPKVNNKQNRIKSSQQYIQI